MRIKIKKFPPRKKERTTVGNEIVEKLKLRREKGEN
jgi:hypothetical protein